MRIGTLRRCCRAWTMDKDDNNRTTSSQAVVRTPRPRPASSGVQSSTTEENHWIRDGNR